MRRLCFGLFVASFVLLCATGSRAGLVAYYPMDDAADPSTVLDTVGGFHGTVQGTAPYTASGGGHTGAPGDHAIDFTSGHVLVSNSGFAGNAVANNAISFSFWQKAGYTPGHPPASSSFWAVSPSAPQGQRGAQAHVPWSNRTIYWDTAGCYNSSTRLTTSGANISDDNDWHHLVFTKDGNHKQIWVDGTLRARQGTATAPLLPFTRLFIGSNSGGGNRFRGLIDDFAVWDHGLSSHQIRLLAAGVPPADLAVIDPGSSVRYGLLANWKLDTVAAGVTPDTLGNYDGTVVGDAATALGKLDYAMDFDGNNDAVNFGDTSIFDNLDAFSVSMWFNRHTDRNDATNHGVDNVLIAESSSAANDNFELGTDGDQVEIYLDARIGNSGVDKTVRSAVPGGIANDVWHHVVVTYDKADGGLKLFFNGAFVASWSEFTTNVDASGSSPLSLGIARVGSNNWGDFDGLIDEVGIWNRALSPEEIAYLYGDGNGRLIIPEPATVAIVLCGLAFLKAGERLRRSKQGE